MGWVLLLQPAVLLLQMVSGKVVVNERREGLGEEDEEEVEGRWGWVN